MTRYGWLAALALLLGSAPAAAQTAAEAPDAPNGITHVPAFDLPLSPFLSPEARADAALAIAAGDPVATMSNPELLRNKDRIRTDADRWALDTIPRLRARYPVDLREERWGKVPVVVVTPRTRPAGAERALLIELHGGGFFFGRAATLGLLDAIPVAAMTGATVVAVDYRQGPEHRFPAASEDVAAVYRAALKRYSPDRVGLFGCSAGGALTAEALAWFQRESLPTPGAAGIFCSSADARYGGDSRYVVAAINRALLPDAAGTLPIMEDFYYGDVDFADPLVSPIHSDATLRRFPPTLFVTATRAAELSAAAHTHSRLTALGVDADLHVWDGLGHAFHLNAELPESQQALDVIARFFRRHLIER